MDVRKLAGRAVLAPGHRVVAVEDQRRMCVAFADEALLPRAALFALGPALPRMEPGTPAAAESTPLVLIEQPRIRIPRRSVERFDLVLAHRLHPTKRRKIQTTRRSPGPVLRMTPEAATGPCSAGTLESRSHSALPRERATTTPTNACAWFTA